MTESLNVGNERGGIFDRLGCNDDSILFFFLILVIIFCNSGCFNDREDDSLLFFFLLLVILFCGGEIF